MGWPARRFSRHRRRTCCARRMPPSRLGHECRRRASGANPLAIMSRMIEAWGELKVRETFAEAARTFADLVPRIPEDRWDAPGLGEWDLRSLVGHTSRSLITVETYLRQPVDTEEVPTPAAYYIAIADLDNAAVAERGRQAGQALGDNPVE